MLAARVAATGRTLADLAGVMNRLPQVLVNVPDVDKAGSTPRTSCASAVAEAEARTGRHGPGAAASLRHRAAGPGDGRGGRLEQARSVAGRLADVVKSSLG